MVRPAWMDWTQWNWRQWPVWIWGWIKRVARSYDYLVKPSWWKTWYYHPNLDEPSEDPDHAEAETWAVNYIPSRADSDKLYGSALKYAERQYDQAFKLGEALDKKLDDLWRNASALGAILAAVTKVFPMVSPIGTTPVIVIALLLLAATVVLAAHTRGPASMAIPMSTKAVLEVIELASEPTIAQVEGTQAASYHFAAVGMNRVNLWKSTQLKRATIVFCLGLFLLVLSMVFAGPSPRLDPTSSPSQTSSVRP